jgi:transcriptional regulator with XRE-family HTH domain
VTATTTWDARRLGRFLAAYRGHLSMAEAARRAGVSQSRWNHIETGGTSTASDIPAVSAHTVAAMCVAVGADIATGLKLAGHDPRDYDYLLDTPPQLMHLRGPLSPGIAVYRAIVDAAAVPGVDPRPMISAIYRDVAAENRLLADRLQQSPPDGRAEYWRGYADALRAVADEQSRMVDTEALPPQ